jgi:serine/threonine protein kinase
MAQGGDANLLGRTIAGKYQIDAFLGGGAMGAVYRARQRALEKVIAIKVMHQEHAKDGMFAARFQREAKAASRLDHPNAMRVFDFGEEPDGLLYIAMEFLDGRDLFRVIVEDWPLSPARIVGLLGQALAALAVAHDMGVVHRDLKPENIMVLRGTDDEGRVADLVKVCDFGIAKISGARDESDEKSAHGTAKLTAQGLVIGTPEYMSPEQGRGEVLDARSDLYSMAVILYQLITGRVPFDAETALGIVLKHVTDEPPLPEQVNPAVDRALAALCMRGLKKKREERFQTARDMRAALRATIEGDLAHADGQSVSPRRLATVESAATMAAPVPAAAIVVSAESLHASGPELASRDTSGSRSGAGTDGLRGVTSPIVALSQGVDAAGFLSSTGRDQPRRSSRRLPVAFGFGFGAIALATGSLVFVMKRVPPPVSMNRAATPPVASEVALPSASVDAKTAARVASAIVPTTLASSTPAPVTSVNVPTAPLRPRKTEPRSPRAMPLSVTTTSMTPLVSTDPPRPPDDAPTPPSMPASVAPVAVPAPTSSSPVVAAPAPPAFNPDAGRVHMERVTATQGLSVAKLRKELSRLQGAWLTCYRTALRSRGSAAGGDALLHLAIDDTGHVTSSSLSGASFLPALASCIEPPARTLRIPDVDTGEATVDVVLTFKSE